MYTHILLPTDGSAHSQVAVDSGLMFATQTECDLIVMASHGTKGITGCKVPVLVYR